MLKELLVVGITDNHIHKRSMAEKKLNFNQAIQITLVMENADKNFDDIAACSNTSHSSQTLLHLTKKNHPLMVLVGIND